MNDKYVEHTYILIDFLNSWYNYYSKIDAQKLLKKRLKQQHSGRLAHIDLETLPNNKCSDWHGPCEGWVPRWIPRAAGTHSRSRPSHESRQRSALARPSVRGLQTRYNTCQNLIQFTSSPINVLSKGVCVCVCFVYLMSLMVRRVSNWANNLATVWLANSVVSSLVNK